MPALLQSASRSALHGDPEFNAFVCQVAEDLEAGRSVELSDLKARRPEYAKRLERLLPTLEAMAALGQSVARAPVHDSELAGTDDHGRIGTVLGEFRLVREIGRGGMGVVYEAEQIPLSRRVALKVLPLASMLDDTQLQRFKNEARAAAALKHPHIVSVYSVGCDCGVHYYAMQLIEGQSLAELLQQLRSRSEPTANNASASGGVADSIGAPGPITAHPDDDLIGYFDAVARWGSDAADALNYAHQQGVLHRDVKPANLLLDQAGRLWITDFGLAHVETDAGLTMTGDLIGTLRYMSPEQVLAEGVVDHRTDVYSLGVTLYELTTLEPAFHHASRSRLIHDIIFGRVQPPRIVNPRIPSELDAIIRKATERESGDRYASAKELADDLRQFLNRQPVAAQRKSSLGQIVKRLRLRRRWVVATALLASLIGVVYAGLVVLVRDADGNEKARLALAHGDQVEVRQSESANERRPGHAPPGGQPAQGTEPSPPPGDRRPSAPTQNQYSATARGVQSDARAIVKLVRPLRSANAAIGDPSLALYFAYGPVDGGSTLIQANWDGTVRGYIELPYSISGLAEDKGRLLATIASSRVGQGRVLAIDDRGQSHTVFRDKKLLPDTTEIWSSPESDDYLVADNGADLVAAIGKDASKPPAVRIRLPHTANYQSMSVAKSHDGSIIFSDSDQNGVFRVPAGAGPTLGKPLLNESGAVASQPGTTIWAAALEDQLCIFDRDQQIAEIAYPPGMSMLRPILDVTSDGVVVLGFYSGNRQYFYAFDLDEKKFHGLFSVEVDRLTALVIAPKTDWSDGDAVQLQQQTSARTNALTGSEQANGASAASSDVSSGFRLAFDGNDDMVKIPSLKYDGSTPITIELRATPASDASFRQLVLISNFAYDEKQDFGISLFQRGDVYPRPNYASWAIAYAGRNGSSHSLIGPANAWEIGKTSHLALVAAGRRYRFYINGKLWKHSKLADDHAPSDQPFTIGGHEMLKGFYQGTIDEVRISKKVRYTKDFTPAQRFERDAATLALYHCDEGTGEVLTDASGNGHDGKISGVTWVQDE